jgi:hypothetical protein
MDQPLGKLEPVDLDDYFENEQHFTTWLAEPDNLNILGAAIGLGELEIEGTEQKETQGPVVPGQTTRAKELRLKFWTDFAEFCKQSGTTLSLHKPAAYLDYAIALGKAGIWLSLTFKVMKETLGCEVAILGEQSKLAFELLQQQKAEIEKERGNLQWDCPAEDGKFGRIAQFRHDDLENRDMWPEFFAWLKERAEAFHKAFSPRVKALKLQLAVESGLDSVEETE